MRIAKLIFIIGLHIKNSDLYRFQYYNKNYYQLGRTHFSLTPFPNL